MCLTQLTKEEGGLSPPRAGGGGVGHSGFQVGRKTLASIVLYYCLGNLILSRDLFGYSKQSEDS